MEAPRKPTKLSIFIKNGQINEGFYENVILNANIMQPLKETMIISSSSKLLSSYEKPLQIFCFAIENQINPIRSNKMVFLECIYTKHY